MHSRRAKRPGSSSAFSLKFEALEQRCLLATFTVLNSNDSGPGSLRQAIADANGLPGADAIEFDAGLSGQTITLGGTELAISESVAIDASMLDNEVTIDANRQSRVVHFTPLVGDLTLRGVRLRRGVATSSSFGGGGGVRFGSNGALTLMDTTVTDNASNRGGGGIHTASGSVTLVDSNVSGNTASGPFSGGGGIHSSDGSVSLTHSIVSGNSSGHSGGGIEASAAGSVTLVDSTVSGNSSSHEGGGIRTFYGSVDLIGSAVSGNSSHHFGGGIVASGPVTLTDSTVNGNTSNLAGGGISAHTVALIGSAVSGNASLGAGGGINTSSATLAESTVSGNSSGGRGGGIHTALGKVTVVDSTVDGNTSGDDGGGIHNASGAVMLTNSMVNGNVASGNVSTGGGIAAFAMTLTDSTVSGNTSSGQGGGIYVRYAGSVTAADSTVSGNSSVFGGGAIHAFSASVTLMSSTVSGNTSSGSGGGVYLYAVGNNPALLSINSIVAGNVDNGTAPDLRRDSGNSLTINYSLIGVGDGLGMINGNLGNLMGSSLSPLDPMLDLLANNGGRTLTRALLPGSPALNAGDPYVVAGAGGVSLFDQRGAGFPRVFGNRIDMGATELQGATTLACDMDGDDACDGMDIDLLQSTLVLGTLEPGPFDLTGDGHVTLHDRDEWLALAGAENLASANSYLLGDANLDGIVNELDFGIWNDNKFTLNSAWTAGDFTADGVINGQDFLVWNSNKFQSAEDDEERQLLRQFVERVDLVFAL